MDYRLNLVVVGRFGVPHDHDPFVPFPLGADAASIPWPPGCRWWLITGNDRALLVGLDGSRGRHTPGALRPSAQREGACAWRGRLRPGARIRALPTGVRFPHT